MIENLDLSKNYGIMLSGGLDSAFLLYLLAKNNPTISLQPFTIPKADGAMLYANPIIDHFNKKFNWQIPYTITVGDPTVHHRQQSTTALKEIFANYKVDYVFVAINQNPPELETYPGAPLRDKRSQDPRIIFPFVDLYKSDILKLIYKHNQEDLINITHSCTERTHERCGVCWQCTERRWAFSELGYEDTGHV